MSLGIIKKISSKVKDKSPIFKIFADLEKHIANTSLSRKQQNIVEIIDNFNNFMPGIVIDRYLVFGNDATLKNNLEKLLENAEYYQIATQKILVLRKNLFDYYFNCLDYAKCEEMTQWLVKQAENNFRTESMTSQEQSVYSEYLNTIGTYYDFAKSDQVKALKYMHKAKDIIEKLGGFEARKFTIYAQLA